MPASPTHTVPSFTATSSQPTGRGVDHRSSPSKPQPFVPVAGSRYPRATCHPAGVTRSRRTKKLKSLALMVLSCSFLLLHSTFARLFNAPYSSWFDGLASAYLIPEFVRSTRTVMSARKPLRLIAVGDGRGEHVAGDVAWRLTVEPIAHVARRSRDGDDCSWRSGSDTSLALDGNGRLTPWAATVLVARPPDASPSGIRCRGC